MKNRFLLEGKMHTELEISIVAAQFFPQRVFASMSLQLLSNSEPPPSYDIRGLSVSLQATHCSQKTNFSCEDQFFPSTFFDFLVCGEHSELLSGQGLVWSAFGSAVLFFFSLVHIPHAHQMDTCTLP